MGTIHMTNFRRWRFCRLAWKWGAVMVVDFLAWHDSESATTPSERPCCKLPTNPLAMGLIPNSTPTTADRDSLTAQVAQLQQASTHTTHE